MTVHYGHYYYLNEHHYYLEQWPYGALHLITMLWTK